MSAPLRGALRSLQIINKAVAHQRATVVSGPPKYKVTMTVRTLIFRCFFLNSRTSEWPVKVRLIYSRYLVVIDYFLVKSSTRELPSQLRVQKRILVIEFCYSSSALQPVTKRSWLMQCTTSLWPVNTLLRKTSGFYQYLFWHWCNVGKQHRTVIGVRRQIVQQGPRLLPYTRTGCQACYWNTRT